MLHIWTTGIFHAYSLHHLDVFLSKKGYLFNSWASPFFDLISYKTSTSLLVHFLSTFDFPLFQFFSLTFYVTLSVSNHMKYTFLSKGYPYLSHGCGIAFKLEILHHQDTIKMIWVGFGTIIHIVMNLNLIRAKLLNIHIILAMLTIYIGFRIIFGFGFIDGIVHSYKIMPCTTFDLLEKYLASNTETKRKSSEQVLLTGLSLMNVSCGSYDPHEILNQYLKERNKKKIRYLFLLTLEAAFTPSHLCKIFHLLMLVLIEPSAKLKKDCGIVLNFNLQTLLVCCCSLYLTDNKDKYDLDSVRKVLEYKHIPSILTQIIISRSSAETVILPGPLHAFKETLLEEFLIQLKWGEHYQLLWNQRRCFSDLGHCFQESGLPWASVIVPCDTQLKGFKPAVLHTLMDLISFLIKIITRSFYSWNHHNNFLGTCLVGSMKIWNVPFVTFMEDFLQCHGLFINS
ncbi:hypothetical protein VP01_1739g1 [Puccinia sorghi]|uniref:Uncharacterized protein n=1 Tax=Puccinia sorghi TaxID=27349 RepID=A0A0L6VFT6_9BASI|nr:hypothetical protein VP01_1739g1 [Puccinia sorghi]